MIVLSKLKCIFLLLVIICLGFVCPMNLKAGQNQKKVDCSLNITQLKNRKGVLWIGFYNSAKGFRDPLRAIYYRKVTTENKQSIDVIFNDITPGKYAIAVFLDENGDGKINFNVLGMPKEKYGFSNNYFPTFRPASFEESSFQLNESMKLILRIQ